MVPIIEVGAKTFFSIIEELDLSSYLNAKLESKVVYILGTLSWESERPPSTSKQSKFTAVDKN